MRFNIDCVRDILLCVEKNTTYRHGIEFYDRHSPYAGEPEVDNGIPEYNKPLFEKYGDNVVLYHVEYCFDDNLTVKDNQAVEPYIGVRKLTPDGHEVLDDIRDNRMLEKAKTVANKIGVGSLPSLRKIISKLAANTINAYFKN